MSVPHAELIRRRGVGAFSEVSTIDETLLGRLEVSRAELETVVDGLTTVTRYDLALVFIPFAFALALVGAYTQGGTLLTAIVPPTLVAIFVIVDVCYLNPPVEDASA